MCAGEFPFEDVQDIVGGMLQWPSTGDIEFSDSLKELLGMLLEVKPEFRLNLDQIRRSEWVNITFKHSPRRLKVCFFVVLKKIV